MLYALGAIGIIIAVWIVLCAPAWTRLRARSWRKTAFAHRGLHGPDCPENSIAAFTQACIAGYGFELDIQMTKDGHLVVFHDDDAARMTGHAGLIRDMTLSEVRALRLSGTDERIPTFSEVLHCTSGRVPMLIEIKSAPNVGAITELTVKHLKGYTGRYLIESFDPLSLFWLKKNAPEVVRGFLVMPYREYRKTQGVFASFIVSLLMTNVLTRPDFVAHSYKMHHNPSLWLCREVFKTPMAQWTIRDRAKTDALIRRGEMPIFEQID